MSKFIREDLDFNLVNRQVYTEFYEQIFNNLKLYTMAIGEEDTLYKYFFYCKLVS